MTDSTNSKSEAAAEKARQKALRPWFKKKRFIIPIVLIVLGGLSSAARPGSSDLNSVSSSSSQSGSSAQTDTSSSDDSSSDTPSETMSQKQARLAATSYLETSSFSLKSLIKQLEFEKFTEEDATYGANAVGADWNEQAAKAAKSYLETSSFSHGSLVDQLEFEGFTPEQAEYGVKAAGL